MVTSGLVPEKARVSQLLGTVAGIENQRQHVTPLKGERGSTSVKALANFIPATKLLHRCTIQHLRSTFHRKAFEKLIVLPPKQPIYTFTEMARCRADMALVRQSRLDSGLGIQVKALRTVSVVPSSLGSGFKKNPGRDWESTSSKRSGGRLFLCLNHFLSLSSSLSRTISLSLSLSISLSLSLPLSHSVSLSLSPPLPLSLALSLALSLSLTLTHTNTSLSLSHTRKHSLTHSP